MTQAEKDKIIKDLQDKLAEAEKIEVEQPKRWKPEYDETYYYVSHGVDVESASWTTGDAEYDMLYRPNMTFDEGCYLTGNCFKTKGEAEERKKQIEYTARYKNYIEEHSEPIDWSNEDYKYMARFNFNDNKIDVNYYFISKNQGTIYASSEQIIWDAIKEIGEDNFKKYVLGVK